MTTWISPINNSRFNLIKKNADVTPEVTNHVINNIAQDLQYLYDNVDELKKSGAASVIYEEPINNLHAKPMMPVYFVPVTGESGGNVWEPAKVTLETETQGRENINHFIYARESFVEGLVLNGSGSDSANILLNGVVYFDVVEHEGVWYVVENEGDVTDTLQRNPLAATTAVDGVFSTATVVQGIQQTSSFTDDDDISPETFKQGVYYLSTAAGVLTPSNEYTILVAVIAMEPAGDDKYKLRVNMFAEGYG
jgi:hypothetical protein